MKDLRQNYKKSQLLESDVLANPIDMFKQWFSEAQASAVIEPNAMTLSTSLDNMVDSRTMLLKGVEDEKFVFFTNYNSKKGIHLTGNPYCSLLFLWLPMERQIIIRGKASKISEADSDEYFNSRPIESRIGAWSSEQSAIISSREELDEQLRQQFDNYQDKEVARPSHWGGYAIDPYEIEFWQGRENRMHDRLLYRKVNEEWELVRLQP